MSKAEKKAESTEVEGTVKMKSMGLRALLSSDKVSEKLAGVVKVFGKCEEIRAGEDGAKPQTIANRCTKAGLKLRSISDEDLKANKEVEKAMGIISKNFPAIKTCMTDAKAEFTDEMQEAYDILLSFGRTEAVDKVPDALNF
jgi:hypothetical protein